MLKICRNIIKMPICRHFCTEEENIKFKFYTRPYINFDIIFQDMDMLRYNLKSRNMLNDVDLDNLKILWSMFKKMFYQRKVMLETKNVLEQRISYLKHNKLQQSLDKYERQLISVKNEWDNFSVYVQHFENAVIPICLKFPVELHSDTPLDESVVKYTRVLSSVEKTNSHHLEVANKLALVEYTNPVMFFLIDDAAIFEIAVISFFRQELDKCNFVEFCNPDIVRGKTIEGCGYDRENPYETFILEGQIREHLVGGASVFPFCAFHASFSNNIKYIPEHTYSVGRQYIPPLDDGHDGLYSVAQRNAVQVFVTAKNFDEMMSEFEKLLDIIKNIYELIGLTYRIVYVPAKQLKQSESLRANIELYLPFSQRYFEIGNVSLYEDYISKRLFMYYHKTSEYNFIFVISGSIVNVPTLLACLLEYSENSSYLNIPECLKHHMLDKCSLINECTK